MNKIFSVKTFKKYFVEGKFETCIIEVSNKGPWMLHKDGDKASLDKVPKINLIMNHYVEHNLI